MALPLLIALAGCGDGATYEVLVDNQSAAALVVVVAGTGYFDTGAGPSPARDPSFQAGAGGPPRSTGLIDAPYSGEQWRPVVRVYTPECELVQTYEVRPGLHVLTISQAGDTQINPYTEDTRFPPSTERMPRAAVGCP